MSNRTALLIFLAIALGLAVLFVAVDGAGVFLARRFAELIRWIAFWR